MTNTILQDGDLNCLLVWPPFDFPDGFYSNLRSYDPPLGLLALAAYVREFDYGVSILDCNLRFKNTDAEFEDYLRDEIVPIASALKVIGFTTTTPSVNACYRMADICKRVLPHVKVIFGGAHASFVPDEALDKGTIDAVVIGEGEETLKELLDGIPFAEIKGLAYRNESADGVTFERTGARGRIKTLDELPMPAYDLIEVEKYRPILGSFKRLPAMMMVSSRGCPWSCSFCRRPVGKMLTVRSAEKIYEEMKFLSETYGIKDISFQDDVFTVNHENVMRLCDMLLEKPLDIRWHCYARVDIVNADLLKHMAKAGCWQIMFGVENFNQGVLNNIVKGVEVEQIFKAIQWTKDAGIEVRICMMVGNPGDTEEIINENIRLLKELDPDYLSMGILTPFPGHDMYNWAVKEGRIMTFDWDMYYGSTPIVRIDALSPEDIVRLYRKMSFEVYFRPRYIWKKFISIRNPTELLNYTKGFFGLLHFALEKAIYKLKPRRSVDRTVLSERAGMTPEQEAHIITLTSTATKQTAIS
jgi:anaerobic magnesium-protoporphyrin IX monomethyl ester cyclase